MANLPLAFAEILAGGIMLTAGITGSSIGDVMKGEVSLTAAPLSGSSSSGSSATASGSSTSTTSTNKYTASPTSSGEKAFADSFLTAIGAAESKTNITALEDWWAKEESGDVLVPGHGGQNNPFEVSTSGAADVPSFATPGNSIVQSYATPQEGVQAAIGYFQEYGPGVLQAFQNGDSISQIEAAVRDLGPNAFGSDTATPWGG